MSGTNLQQVGLLRLHHASESGSHIGGGQGPAAACEAGQYDGPKPGHAGAVNAPAWPLR